MLATKTFFRWAMPVSALGFAVALLGSVPGSAFTLLGHKLPPGQRDFRIFNNFADASANDNQVPDPNFPGAQGAVLAIWKAGVEWGSLLHADGEGDPHQPGDLGSGGANFDFSYQGESLSTGSMSENTHSALAGSSGGTTHFVEVSPAGGWRARYYETWTWNDGPGTTIPGGDFDLQSAAARNFGIALGLGNSAIAAATMAPFSAPGNVEKRSIEDDDIAGVQANYGAASPLKPIVTGLLVQGNQISVTGSNFDPVDNTIWFTRELVPFGDGDVLTLTGVPSSLGGTFLTAVIPADAQSGDLLVRNQVAGAAGISNAWPYALDDCPPPTLACDGEPNSVSATGASLAFMGSQSLAANAASLAADDLPPGTPYLPILGTQSASVPLGMGVLCIGSPIVRLTPGFASAGGQGTIALDLPTPAPGTTIQSGETWLFQVWYRDSVGGSSTSNLSSAIAVPFCD